MLRVLQCVNDMHRAGLETMLMNYYRHIDRNRIQFDFLTHRPYSSDYDEEILSLGGKIYHAPRLYPQNYPAYFRWMKNFFHEHPKYQIVHSHIDSMSYLPLLAAKRAKIPYRIAHSHNTLIDKDFKYILKQYFRYKLPDVANYYCACGKQAGEFLFPNKNFTIIPNAIEADKFKFSEDLRKKKRRELNVENDFVVGHVGRFSYAKNHKFLINIFLEIHKKKAKSVLLLVGVGEKEDEVRKQVSQLRLENQVRFLGNRSDVNELYQAMDVLLMPSLFEGIPVVGVEAQFADLPCFFSENVPQEVQFNHNVNFISLAFSPGKWAEQIISYDKISKKRNNNIVENSRYNIQFAHSILEEFYLNLLNQ